MNRRRLFRLFTALSAVLLVSILSVVSYRTFWKRSPFPRRYDIVEIFPPIGYKRFVPDDINNLGQVVGYVPGLNGKSPMGFLWEEERGFTALGEGAPHGVNDSGEVIGTLYPAGLTGRPAWLRIGEATKGFQIVDELAVSFRDINNRGLVAGSARDATGGRRYRSVTWDSTWRVHNIPHPTSFRSVATSINDKGSIAGVASHGGGPSDVGFIWDSTSGYRQLPGLGGNWCKPTAINERGEVVGAAETIARIKHAYHWEAGNGATDLGTLGRYSSRAGDINDRGQIVGEYELTSWLETQAK